MQDKQLCYRCGGYGSLNFYSYGQKAKVCPNCDGSGYIPIIGACPADLARK